MYPVSDDNSIDVDALKAKLDQLKGLNPTQQQDLQTSYVDPREHLAADQASKSPDQDDDSEDDDAESTPSAPASAAPSQSDGQPATPAKSTDTPNIASLARLQDLQAKSNQLQGLINAGRGATTTAYAMMGKSNPFEGDFKTQSAQAAQLPEQYLQQVDFQKQDPNSAISKTYRDMAAQLDMPISEQTSAAEIEKAFPQIVNIKTREDMIDAKKEMAQDRMQEQHFRNQMMQLQLQDRATQRQQMAETKQNQIDARRYDTYAAKLALPSSRAVLGQAQNQIYAVDRVDALLHNHGELNNITPNEMVEVAKGLDRVISGGASTLEGSKSLDPATAKEWIANQLQKITNVPQGAQGGAFLARISQNLQKEKEVAIKQAARQTQVLLAGSADLAQRNPDAYKDFLNKADINPELQDFLITGKKPMTIDQHQAALNRAGVGSAPELQPASPSGMVKVKTSDGKVWNIPKEKLADAQSRDAGLQVIQ